MEKDWKSNTPTAMSEKKTGETNSELVVEKQTSETNSEFVAEENNPGEAGSSLGTPLSWTWRKTTRKRRTSRRRTQLPPGAGGLQQQ